MDAQRAPVGRMRPFFSWEGNARESAFLFSHHDVLTTEVGKPFVVILSGFGNVVDNDRLANLQGLDDGRAFLVERTEDDRSGVFVLCHDYESLDEPVTLFIGTRDNGFYLYYFSNFLCHINRLLRPLGH